MVDAHIEPAGWAYRRVRDLISGRRSRQTRYGFTLAGDPRMTKDGWEAEEIKLFLEMLPGHSAVIDIGANIGFYSCLAGSRGKPTIAIEPSPRNIRYLLRNLLENGVKGVELCPLGLAESAGRRTLYGYGGAASLVEGWAQSKRGESVLTTTLDEVLAGKFEGERLLIKIDVEGYELAVVRGAARTLSRDPRPTWLVEVLQHDPLIPSGHNDQFQATLELFRSAGYRQRRVDEKNFLFSGG